MKCNVQNCKFKSDKIGQGFELDKKLSSKHNKHSDKYYVHAFKIIFFLLENVFLDHEMGESIS